MTYWIVPKTRCFLLLIKINSNHLTTRSFLLTVDLRTGQVYFWACLHGGGIPGGWGNPLRYNLSILRWSRLRDRWGNPPHVTSPTWGPSHSCKQALRKGSLAPHDSSPTQKISMESANLKTKINEPITVSQQCEVYGRNVIKKRVLIGSVKKYFNVCNNFIVYYYPENLNMFNYVESNCHPIYFLALWVTWLSYQTCAEYIRESHFRDSFRG